MYSLLLKKALPFTLTLVLGSLVGGLFNFFGTGGQTPAPARAYSYGYGEGHCCRGRMRHRYLVAETKPLNILNVPEASLTAGAGDFAWSVGYATAKVTFGADGKVHEVVPGSQLAGDHELPSDKAAVARDGTTKLLWDAVERAARQIQFEPEVENGLPVTVTRDVRILVSVNERP